jgi:hypothetical protein
LADALAIAGSVFGAIRHHELTLAATPLLSASSPRYLPQGNAATATSTGEPNGLTPKFS